MDSTESLIHRTLERATPLFAIIARKDVERQRAPGGTRDAKLHGAYAEAKEASMAVRVAVTTGALRRDRAAETLDGLDHTAAILHLKRMRRF